MCHPWSLEGTGWDPQNASCAPYGAFCESFIFDFVQFRCNLEHKFVVSITIIEIWITDNSDLESVSESEDFRLELSWNVW